MQAVRPALLPLTQKYRSAAARESRGGQSLHDESATDLHAQFGRFMGFFRFNNTTRGAPWADMEASRWIHVPVVTLAAVALTTLWLRRRRSNQIENKAASEVKQGPRHGYAALIGRTALTEIVSLSKLTGRKIFVKCEHLNPGGTGKDRIALSMLLEAEASGKLKPGGTVVEGTSGSTGIALAALCAARGYKLIICMPDDQSDEKMRLLRRFGATLHVVKTASISNPDHYVNHARRLAAEIPGAVFMDQFENGANFQAHFEGTGPEIWAGTNGRVDAFVMSAGTGGTIAGVSRFLKAVTGGRVKVVLADPPGSSLLNYVKHGVCYAPQQAERRVRKHRYDTIAEGIGLDRITSNLAKAKMDEVIALTDQDALDMAHFLMRREGLFVGSSSAMNVAAAVMFAHQLPPGSSIVTVICDSGQRHVTRFWNEDFTTREFKLHWPSASDADASVVAMVGRLAAGASSDAL